MSVQDISSDRLMAITPYQGEPKPVIPETFYKKALQPTGVTYIQDPPEQNAQQGSKTDCLILERPLNISNHPPMNFSKVSDGLYRSGYPQAQDYPFMQGLNLKTIVTLVDKELPEGYQEFIQDNHITHRVFDMAGTKKEEISVELMRSIQEVVSNDENYPLLIHCNHGKHRTGCVVGVLRKSHQWDMKRVIDEYTRFAAPKVRETDLKYLTDFKVTNLPSRPQWAVLPVTPSTFGRYCRFVIVVTLTLFTLYPLGRITMSEGPKMT